MYSIARVLSPLFKVKRLAKVVSSKTLLLTLKVWLLIKSLTTKEYGSYKSITLEIELGLKSSSSSSKVDKEDDLILDKLTVQEIKYAEEEIKKLITGSSEELPKKIKVESQKENYLSLPMVDAYILHIIDRINYVRNMNEFNNILNWQLDSNVIMRQKSKLRRR